MNKNLIAIILVLVLLSSCNLPTETQPAVDLVATEVARILTETSMVLATLPGEATTIVPTDEPVLASPTLENTATDTHTPTEVPTATETATPLPTQTNTTTFTATPTSDQSDPTVRYGSPDMSEDFSSGASKWDYEDDWSSFKVENGFYNITSKKQAYWNSWFLVSPRIDDFYLEMTFDMPTCSGDDRIGLAFRAPDANQFYFLGITCSGKWAFEIYTEDNTIENLLPYTLSNELNPTNEKNRAGVLVDGNNFEFYINGKKVGETTDSSLSKAGSIGFITRFVETLGFTTRIDKLQYWLLP